MSGKRIFSHPSSERSEDGNVLFMILIAIALMALLAVAVTQSSEQQSTGMDRQVIDSEISRMKTQSAALSSALNQMVINGESAETLYSTVSTLKPGDAGYETSPHSLKIYHPLGGGISYMAASSNNISAAYAKNFSINAASIVSGVGKTDVTTGDILFTAIISSAEACQRINETLTGSKTVPVMTTAIFDALFTAGTTVTIDGTNCPSCLKIARICVSNSGATAWGYYESLMPG